MYLNITDLQKGMRSEILTTITRNQDNVAEQAIAEAEQEVASYLSARYDIASELQKTPSSADRNTMVVKLVRDIALYNIHNFTAPVNIPENRKQCYERAVAMLKAAQAEKANIVGLARLNTADDGTTASSYIAYGGNTKRDQHI